MGRKKVGNPRQTTPGRRRLMVYVAVLTLAAVAGVFAIPGQPLLTVRPLPHHITRRAGDVTVNVNGSTSLFVSALSFRLNDGEWKEVQTDSRRTPDGQFIAEIPAAELRTGLNTVTLRAEAPLCSDELRTLEFEYDPAPVRLPIEIDWERVPDDQLCEDDGAWERFDSGDGWRVRPVPGKEGYDRILSLTGTFEGPRRVETEVVFRGETGEGLYGFGVLGMWGGRPDSEGITPRRGWNIGLGWYYSKYEGVGVEFSYRDGAAPPGYLLSYRDLAIERDVLYRVIMECWPERDRSGHHQNFYERMKWWKKDTPEPEEWIVLTDKVDKMIPPGEYGVAFIVHRCQAEFGTTRISRLLTR